MIHLNTTKQSQYPDINIGNEHNDFGRGFYCTKMAKEWACKQNTDGFANRYELNTDGLPLRSLNKALKLGKLGEQTVLVSRKAIDQIKFIDAAPVSKDEYYPKFINRDSSARKAFKQEIKKSKVYRDDIFVLDILREEMQYNDPRIQRIISE